MNADLQIGQRAEAPRPALRLPDSRRWKECQITSTWEETGSEGQLVRPSLRESKAQLRPSPDSPLVSLCYFIRERNH